MIRKTAVFLLLLACSVSARPAEPGAVWFDDLLAPGPHPTLLFLAVGEPGSPARVHFAGAGSEKEARARLDRIPIVRHASGTVWRKFERVVTVEPAGPEPLVSEPGVDGLAFARETGLVFLPGEVMAGGLVDTSGRWRPDRAAVYLARRGRTLPEGLRPEFLFTTRASFSTRDGEVPLFREHRSFPVLDRALLLAAAREGGRYLTRITDPKGRFTYSYFAKSDHIADTYNLVRHAGTVYAMAELYEVAPDPLLARALDRALAFLLEHVVPAGGDTALVACKDREKLGGNALAAVAIARHAEATGCREHLPLLIKLGRRLLDLQAENGEFPVHLMTWPGGKPLDHVSEYYPGEALLALLRIEPFDPEGPWLDRAERGARWLIEVRDAGLETYELAHDHWLLYALCGLMRRRPGDLYRDHALKIAAAIVEGRNTDPMWPDWYGSWYRPPRSTPAATRSEGLVCAYEIAQKAGDKERAAAILTALRDAVSFQLTMQFRPESAMHLPKPWLALGGFHASLTNYEIRIDYVQHNLSALIGLWRILGER
jgi:hypothetical protein